MQNSIRREEPASQSIGQRLARARLEKGVTLADASSTTKLKTAYLEAMESDKFEDLPAPYYTRNFIKTYARYLDLDGVQIADEFSRTAPQAAQLPVRQDTDALRHTSMGRERLMSHPLLFAAAIVVVILLILYFSSSSGERGMNASTTKSAVLPTADAADSYSPVFTARETLPTIE